MQNKQFFNQIQQLLLPFAGSLVTGNQSRPAILFGDDGGRNGEISGLEILVSPRSMVRKRYNASVFPQSSHFVELINHEGIHSIYEADEKLAQFAISSGASDWISKMVQHDIYQKQKPAILYQFFYIEDDCCLQEKC